jgi:hypothetical protein
MLIPLSQPVHGRPAFLSPAQESRDPAALVCSENRFFPSGKTTGTDHGLISGSYLPSGPQPADHRANTLSLARPDPFRITRTDHNNDGKGVPVPRSRVSARIFPFVRESRNSSELAEDPPGIAHKIDLYMSPVIFVMNLIIYNRSCSDSPHGGITVAHFIPLG